MTNMLPNISTYSMEACPLRCLTARHAAFIRRINPYSSSSNRVPSEEMSPFSIALTTASVRLLTPSL